MSTLNHPFARKELKNIWKSTLLMVSQLYLCGLRSHMDYMSMCRWSGGSSRSSFISTPPTLGLKRVVKHKSKKKKKKKREKCFTHICKAQFGGQFCEKVSLNWLTSPYFELREKLKCIEHIWKSKFWPKFLPEILKTSPCLRALGWPLHLVEARPVSQS